MNAFFLVYDDKCGSEESVLKYIDDLEEVTNWQTTLPNSVFIISEYDSHELSTLLSSKFHKGLFLITRIDEEDVNGLLPEDVWDFINNPESA